MKLKKVTGPIVIAVLFLTSILLGYELTQSNDIPKGWIKAGSNPESYEIGVEKEAGPGKKNAAFIKSIKSDIKGFGTLMQSISAENYIGKRIKLSGYIKTKDVVSTSGFWMRIDDKEKTDRSIAFDNMSNRPVKGNSDWKIYQIVLDVTGNSGLISFGALISGTGEIWFSNLKFEVVDKSVPLTDMMNPLLNERPKGPVNLDFQ